MGAYIPTPLVPCELAARSTASAVCWSGAAGVIAALILIGMPVAAHAHPHIFIEQHVVALFDQSGLTGFKFTWRFDPMYSSMMRADFVSSRSGPLTPADIKSLHDKSFVDLKAVHYFTRVTFNNKPLSLGIPTDFSAASAGGSIVYTFVIPLKPKNVQPKNTVTVTVFDPSYYVYYDLAKDDPVTVTGGANLAAVCAPSVVWRPTQGWGSVHSDLVSCTYHAPG
jgi:ABC-type uncharacterized transport system substrate-binding protein